MPGERGLHILVLTDRDWTHPQGGGTGANLYGQVAHWLAWGHRVTVISGAHPGAAREESPAPGLTLHHVGSRLTVFPRAAWLVKRGRIRDVDVALEVVNGIAFFTPLWRLGVPRAAMVFHVHRDMYVEELGRTGAVAAWALETLPLRHLYSGTRFVTISNAARDALVEVGVAERDVDVVYCGVEADAFGRGERTPGPSLLYLGRLKRYKRLELLLDVLEAVPGAHLDIAGDGDHREALEREIAARGLAERVTMHGFVSEQRKRELYASSWLTLTASSAEGWCLTVMEAACCGTPSAALAVGGLRESIVDGETGILAETPEELARRVAALMADPAERERMGAAAEARARTFTWDRAAAETLATLDAVRATHRPRLRSALAKLRRSTTGVAVATLVANALALVLTMLLARELGVVDYGALAALSSALFVVAVPGAVLQAAIARGAGPPAVAELRRWSLGLAGAAVVLAAAGALAREPLADLLGVGTPWAAAAVLPAGVLASVPALWRGAFQAAGRHGPVAASLLLEGAGRLAAAVVLVAAGLGVAGAVLAVAAGALLGGVPLARAVPEGTGGVRLRTLAVANAAGLAALTLCALIQHIDVVVAQHRLDDAAAGAYAAAAVASKVVVWAAVGLSLALLPELSRHARRGGADRGRLVRALALVALLSAPLVLVCALAAGPVLRLVFGPGLDGAADALPWLALAMALFACAVVAVQHALAVGRRTVVALVAAAAVAEPLVLRAMDAAAPDLAHGVVAIQLAIAAAVIALALRPARAPTGEAGP
ncbi:MAG TPA: glycosyltransferase [Solirubrobacteraceae bacterium]|nr:glycosyltransferase [Solirubrobacteraceae bacterium]